MLCEGRVKPRRLTGVGSTVELSQGRSWEVVSGLMKVWKDLYR